MTTTHISSDKFKTTKWSGGLTTELFIYPSNASYVAKDFSFRLSTATVEVQESIFTPLQSISRTLLVLRGEMKLSHKNHHSVSLESGDIDRFDGGWETSSFGTCSDFNLMTMGGTTGDLASVNLMTNENQTIQSADTENWLILFLNFGGLVLSYEDQNYHLVAGDLLVIPNPSNSSLQIASQEESQLVKCTIKQP